LKILFKIYRELKENEVYIKGKRRFGFIRCSQKERSVALANCRAAERLRYAATIPPLTG
jgi:hypothetical protein